MPASPAALLFNLCEVGPLVPVGFGVVVIGDGIESRRFCLATSDDAIRYADNRGRISATAQLSEDGAVGTEMTLNRLEKNGAEMLFVLGV